MKPRPKDWVKCAPHEPKLAGRVALISGGDSGIGRAVAIAMATEGADIAILYLDEHRDAKETVLSIEGVGRRVFSMAGDVGDERFCRRAVARAVKQFGHLDILVNNAGIQHTAPFGDVTTELWNDILAVNLSAAFHTMRHALPRMAKASYGRVINIASVHGLVASVSKAPYVSAKFGLVGLSKVAALEYAGIGSADSGGVTVNCICPGWVDTALVAPQIAERREELGVSSEAAIDALLAEKQPSRRLSSPAEIARLAVWLCAADAHNITGTAIPVDGGWTAQ